MRKIKNLSEFRLNIVNYVKIEIRVKFIHELYSNV